jgi:hypothetical protein
MFDLALKGGVTKCALFTPQMALTLLKVTRVLVRFDHVASFIVNANDGIVRAAAKLCVADCIAGCVRLAAPQATEWQRIGNHKQFVAIAIAAVFRTRSGNRCSTVPRVNSWSRACNRAHYASDEDAGRTTR